HTAKRFADIPRSGDRIRLPIRALRVHVNQTHLYGAERVIELTIAGVALVGKPDSLRTPINVFFRLPNVFATAAKTKGLESHGFQGNVTSENHQVSPG